MSNSSQILNDYVGQVKAAEMLGLSISRISQLCKQSRFDDAIKIGGAWLIPKIAIENFTRRKPGRKKKVASDRLLIENALKENNKRMMNTSV